jgi:hypothetical protein
MASLLGSKRARCLCSSLILAAVAAYEPAAQAQASGPSQPTSSAQAQTTAETLFDEGRELMAKGDYARACPKLAESQRLDPGGGTILNLALCHEAQGKKATAWAEFKDAIAYAIRDGRQNRERMAREHVAKLEPTLNRISVKPAADARVPGLEIRVDGVAIGEAAWESPTPIDPGEHVVSAVAPGYREWTTTIKVDDKVDLLPIAIPRLEEKPPEPVVTGPGTTIAPLPAPKMSGARRGVIFAGYGIGVAGVAIGAIFGVLTVSKRSSSDRTCATDTTCDAQGVINNNAAIFDSWVSTAAFGVGLAGAAVGTFALLTAPSAASPRQTGFRFVPQVAPGSAGLTVVRPF